MKVSKKRLLISLLLSVFCLSMAVFFNIPKQSVVLAETTAEIIGENPLESSYVVGDSIVVPARKISYGEVEYQADWYIQKPNGKRVHSAEIVLTDGGTYQLVYYCDVNGVRVKAIQEFFVYSKLYEVTSERSTISYGQSEYENVRGLNVSLASGDYFNYNRAINISGYDSLDNIISLIITPIEVGVADATQVNVILTDAYDSENYIVISVKQNLASVNNYNFTSYANANAGDIQLPTGIEKHTSGTFNFNGDKYKIHVNNKYGAYLTFSMTGIFKNSALKPGAETLGVSLDVNTLCAYVNNGTSPVIVSDLDNSAIYENVWKGFTKNEVFVSVSAQSYNQGTFNFCVQDIGKQETVTENAFENKVKPTIEIYAEMPVQNAIAGLYYPVYPAKASSPYDTDPELQVRAYFGYGSEHSQFEIDITDGKFLTEYSGTYTIVYTAKDCLGNVQTSEVHLDCVKTDKRLSITTEGDNTQGKIAMPVKVADYTVDSYYGNNYSVKVTATHVSSGTIYHVDENLEFIPYYSGEYKINYECSDLTDSCSYSYNLTVTASPIPVLDDCLFPEFVIINANHEFPTVYATDYTYEIPQKTDSANLGITEYKNGTPIKTTHGVSGDYKVGECDYIIATYTITTKGGSVSKAYRATAVDVGYGNTLDMSAYFYDKESAFESTKNLLNIVFSTNAQKSSGQASLKFIRKLSTRNFEIRVGGKEEQTAFRSFFVKLKGENGNELILTYKPNGKDTEFYLNGKYVGNLGQSFFDSTKIPQISYDELTLKCSPASGLNIEVKKYLPDFNGLGRTLDFELGFDGVTGDAGFVITRVCQQIMGSGRDVIAPNIDAYSVKESKKIGDEVTIKGVNVIDVLDPEVTCTFTLYRPDGSVAKDVNGKLSSSLDYTEDHIFVIDAYGSWLVEYVATDTNGKQSVYTYTINVPDVVPPVITLENIVTSAKTNTKVALAKANVTDNMGEVTVTVLLKDAYGRYQIVTNDYFVCNLAGTYTVYYYALDTAGNLAVANYTVLVED